MDFTGAIDIKHAVMYRSAIALIFGGYGFLGSALVAVFDDCADSGVQNDCISVCAQALHIQLTLVES